MQWHMPQKHPLLAQGRGLASLVVNVGVMRRMAVDFPWKLLAGSSGRTSAPHWMSRWERGPTHGVPKASSRPGIAVWVVLEAAGCARTPMANKQFISSTKIELWRRSPVGRGKDRRNSGRMVWLALQLLNGAGKLGMEALMPGSVPAASYIPYCFS